MANEELEALKQEAKDLGIEFSANIGAAKLKEKIDAHYESQETSGEEIMAAVKAVEAKEKSEEKPAVKSTGEMSMAALARELYEKACKTVVVTIIDNDQRVNNQTTTVPVNWSNQYYDLGTVSFPLNTPIEIQQGFINVLKECTIPHHVKDPKTNLSTTVMRQRYTISYEQAE